MKVCLYDVRVVDGFSLRGRIVELLSQELEEFELLVEQCHGELSVEIFVLFLAGYRIVTLVEFLFKCDLMSGRIKTKYVKRVYELLKGVNVR